jgi:hypothetical protein
MPRYHSIPPGKKPPFAGPALYPDTTPAPLFHKTAKPTVYRTAFSTKASGFRLNLPNHQNNNQPPKTARTINTNHRQINASASPTTPKAPATATTGTSLLFRHQSLNSSPEFSSQPSTTPRTGFSWRRLNP